MAHRQSSIDLSVLPASSVVFTNCRLCIAGTLTAEHSALIVSKDGSIDKVLLGPCIVPQEGEQSSPELIDLQNAILAPGLLELQTNGMRGFHFTHFESPDQYASKVDDVARYLPSQGEQDHGLSAHIHGNCVFLFHVFVIHRCEKSTLLQQISLCYQV